MGDLQLSENPFYSRHSDAVVLTEVQAQALNLQGMGLLRDLRGSCLLNCVYLLAKYV